jgi:hypothetical protein
MVVRLVEVARLSPVLRAVLKTVVVLNTVVKDVVVPKVVDVVYAV